MFAFLPYVRPQNKIRVGTFDFWRCTQKNWQAYMNIPLPSFLQLSRIIHALLDTSDFELLLGDVQAIHPQKSYERRLEPS